jgi:hypothetical protein
MMALTTRGQCTSDKDKVVQQSLSVTALEPLFRLVIRSRGPAIADDHGRITGYPEVAAMTARVSD